MTYLESRAYTTKTRPYTLCITKQRRSTAPGLVRWITESEERHSFRSQPAIIKYLIRNVVFQHTWIAANGQAIRAVGKTQRVVLWGYHQASNEIIRTDLNISLLVERAKIARNREN